MKVIVKPHKIKIELEHDYNSGEYNVQECNFEFSDEYTGLSKVVIFSNSNVTKEIQIYDDKCIVPAEVLQNEGVVGIGVYGYEVSGDELTLRYSPKPQCFSVEKGSYAEGTQPVPPTPSVVEQLQQQITNNANNISSLQDLTALHGEQIETNANDISAIKSEQTTQNNKIQANTEEIESINGIIPTLAKKTEIPTKVSQLENDSNYVTETEMSNAIDEEKTERENADIELQSQIDAITVSPDVVDVVGTYQELLDYDTSKLTDDDIIKVLVDSTHNDALSYYRWQITGGIGSWQYIGSEGPFYTKSETNSLLNEKQDEITNDNKLDSDLVRDDGQTNKFVTVQEKTTWNNKQDALTFDNAPTENSNNPVKSGGIYDFVNTKLEDYVLETDFVESQSLQDDEIARNKMIYNAMPKVSGEGTDLTLNNTAECPVYDIELSPSELEQETTSGKNLFNINGDVGTRYNGATSSTANTVSGNDLTSITNGNSSHPFGQKIYVGVGTTVIASATLKSVTYDTLPSDSDNVASIRLYDDNDATTRKNYSYTFNEVGQNKSLSFTASTDYIFLTFSRQTATTSATFTDIQLELGDTATSYEPFTNGPSPNPQYPQEIHTVSGENSVKVGNKNLLNIEWLVSEGITVENGLATGKASAFTSNFGIANNLYIPNTNNFGNKQISLSVSAYCDGSVTTGSNELTVDINYTDGTRTRTVFSNNTTTKTTKTMTSISGKEIKSLNFSYINGPNVIWHVSDFIITYTDTPQEYVPYTIQSLPLSLGDLEYCKIGDYEDLFFKNVIGSEYYDSTLELDKWYLKKNIGKVVLDGSESGWDMGTGTNVFMNTNIFNNTYLVQNAYSNYFKNIVNENITGTGTANNNLQNNEFSFRWGTKDRIYIKTDIVSTIADFKNWLSTHNTIVYYVLATPTYTLLSDTLQTQLDNIHKAISYQDQTNVSQTNNDLPFVIKLSAIRDLSGIFELIQ